MSPPIVYNLDYAMNKYHTRNCLIIEDKVYISYDSEEQKQILREYTERKNGKNTPLLTCIHCGSDLMPYDMGIMGSIHQICSNCIKQGMPGKVLDTLEADRLPGGISDTYGIVCILDWTGEIYIKLRRRE